MTKHIKCNTMDIHKFMKDYKFGYDTVKGEMGVFEYHDFEKKVVDLINDNRFSMILKGRQQNISTILAAYSAWSVINGKRVIYFTINYDLAKHFLERVRLMLIKYNAKFEHDTKKKIKLEGGGYILSISTPTAFCGHKGDIIIYDEAAYIKRFKEAYVIGAQSLCPWGKIIVASTPNEYDEFFKLWEGSIRGENDFKRIKITYKDNPRFDENWAEKMKKGMNYDETQIAKELYADFVQPKPKLKNKNRLIQFRVDNLVYKRLSEKLLEKDLNISIYMRNLILKDMNK